VVERSFHREIRQSTSLGRHAQASFFDESEMALLQN
jgi:hypothetical protein